MLYERFEIAFQCFSCTYKIIQTVDDLSLLLTDNEFRILQTLSDSILEPLCEIFQELTNPISVAAGFVFPAIYSLVNYELACTRDNLADAHLVRFADLLLSALKQEFHFVFEHAELNSAALHKLYLCATLLDCRFKQFQFVRDERERFALLSRAKSSLIEFYANSVQQNSMVSNKSPSMSNAPSTVNKITSQASISNGDTKRKPSFVEKMLNR